MTLLTLAGIYYSSRPGLLLAAGRVFVIRLELSRINHSLLALRSEKSPFVV